MRLTRAPGEQSRPRSKSPRKKASTFRKGITGSGGRVVVVVLTVEMLQHGNNGDIFVRLIEDILTVGAESTVLTGLSSGALAAVVIVSLVVVKTVVLVNGQGRHRLSLSCCCC